MAGEPAAADPTFSIDFDAREGILHMRLSGFWTLGTLVAYTARLVVETSGLRLRRKAFDVLSDSRDFAVQSAEVTAGFDALSTRAARLHTGRTAIVVGSRLNKIQAERSLGSERVRIFLDMDEAREWLMIDRRQSAA